MTRYLRKFIHWTPRILYAVFIICVSFYATALIVLSPQMRFSESYIYFFPSIIFFIDGIIIAVKANLGAMLLSFLSLFVLVFFQVHIGTAFIFAAISIALLFLWDYQTNNYLYRKHKFFRYL